jgi:hypothetical protein
VFARRQAGDVAFALEFASRAAGGFALEASKADRCKHREVVAIRKYFLLCCERFNFVFNILTGSD